MKICFIGAGSIGFTQKLIRDILKIPEFNDVTFSLNDISEQNLNFIKQLIEKDISFNKHILIVKMLLMEQNTLLTALELVGWRRLNMMLIFLFNMELINVLEIRYVLGEYFMVKEIFLLFLIFVKISNLLQIRMLYF